VVRIVRLIALATVTAAGIAWWRNRMIAANMRESDEPGAK